MEKSFINHSGKFTNLILNLILKQVGHLSFLPPPPAKKKEILAGLDRSSESSLPTGKSMTKTGEQSAFQKVERQTSKQEGPSLCFPKGARTAVFLAFCLKGRGGGQKCLSRIKDIIRDTESRD